MSRRKKSFFERLTGTINMNEDEEREPRHIQPEADDEYQEFENDFVQHSGDALNELNQQAGGFDETYAQEEDEGELAVDVYETPEHVVVQAMVAGVRPDQLDVSITRETCTISGRREAPRDVGIDSYLHEELYWGAFSRMVTLPEEVEVEESEASENHGLLTIHLPKINKDLETKLEVQAE